jgi:hypothetical protein
VPPTRPVRRRLEPSGTIPATRFTPFEDFPSPAAAPHHCGRCPPAVTVLPGSTSGRNRLSCRPPLAEARDVHPRSYPGRHPTAPRGGDRPRPVRRRRASEEVGLLSRVSRSSEEFRFHVGWGAPCSEESGVPCPDEAVSRRSEEPLEPWSLATRRPTRRSVPLVAPR